MCATVHLHQHLHIADNTMRKRVLKASAERHMPLVPQDRVSQNRYQYCQWSVRSSGIFFISSRRLELSWRYTGTNRAVNSDTTACLFIRFTRQTVNYFIKNYKVRNVYAVCAVLFHCLHLFNAEARVKSQQIKLALFTVSSLLPVNKCTLYDCLVLGSVLLCKLGAVQIALPTGSFYFHRLSVKVYLHSS